jgi:hypothetical protein
MNMLAEVHIANGLGRNVLVVFCVICIGLIVWQLGRFFFPKLGAPAIVLTVWDGLFVLIGAVAVINFLAGLMGHPLITW